METQTIDPKNPADAEALRVAEPNAVQKRVMRCVPCPIGGWFVFDVASIGD